MQVRGSRRQGNTIKPASSSTLEKEIKEKRRPNVKNPSISAESHVDNANGKVARIAMTSAKGTLSDFP